MAHVPLKVGLIGYGMAGQTFHAPLLATTPGLHLAAIASSKPDLVQADWPNTPVVATPADLLALPELDLVVIATPNATHAALAAAALAADKHVVVDKPFTLTLAEAEALRAEAEQRELVLAVFHNRRWDADFLTLRQLLIEGQLGRVVHYESHFDRYRPLVRDRWREQPGPGSGVWYDLGPHLLDQALQLFGPPEALWADLAAQRDGAVSDDYFHVVLRYGPLRVILHAATLVAATGPRLIVHGTAGSYVKSGLDPQEAALRAGERPDSPTWGHDPNPGTLTTYQGDTAQTRLVPGLPGTYPAFYAGVRDAIHGLGPNPVPASEAMQVMALLELAQRSAAERCEVTP
ncbi:MAG: oxidoreductase [Oscillochloridaceae bacterium umkhey_bin13]